MRTTFAFISAAVLGVLFATPPTSTQAQGFTESDAVFFGEVRKASGGQTFLLQSGELKITFVNQTNSANRVTLTTSLTPTGNGDYKPYSYALKVPLAYLPEAGRMQEFLSINTLATKFKVEQITIDGMPATLPDGSSDFYVLNFASRASQYRLDLLVAGESNSTAEDGIPDWWKTLYGLALNANIANDDPDGDGWSNLQEFLRGGNPNKSNRVPQMVTSEFLVPELGEAGVYMQFLDSDTPDAQIQISVSTLENSGFELKLDGVPLDSEGPQNLTFEDLKSGRVTVAHVNRAERETAVFIQWNDGGDILTGQVAVRAMIPSTEDGGESSLWLDGYDLPAAGSKITSWQDRSGRGRSAMQPTPEFQPVVTEHAADFTTSKSAHLFFQDSSLPAGDHTVLAAYQAADSSDTAQTVLSTNRGFLQVAATSQAISYPGAPVYQMDATAVRGYESTSGEITTSIFRRQANVMQNIFGLSYDGEGSGTTSIEPVLPTLGARRSAVPADVNPVDQALYGRIQEVLVFPTALPEQKLRGVNDYLQSKWRGAVIWNFSTEMKNVTLTTGQGSNQRIVRGGFGIDQLSGGPGDDILSGGGGDDTLTGGLGKDTFIFGAIDLGRDTISDFDPAIDTIDVSALFWGLSGDARQFISVRQESNTINGVPSLDTVLIVQRPDSSKLEIVLRQKVITATQLIPMIAEGHIRMGGLSIPTGVQLALAPGSSTTPLDKSVNGTFKINVTRSGVGVPAALDVPVGFFQDGAGGRFVVEGATSSEGLRSVVSFARGETSKTLTVRPLPDLDAQGLSTLQVAVLPNYKYSVNGAAVTQAINDNAKVWLEIIQPNALATPAQPARVLVHRNGSVAKSLIVDLQVAGTAVNGVTMTKLPASVTIPVGKTSFELQVLARAAGLTAGPKVALIKLASRDRYLLGNPHEGLVYIGNTAQETNGAGFDRWLGSVNGGSMQSHQLLSLTPAAMQEYVLAYSLGLNSVEQLKKHRMRFDFINSRPEFSNLGPLKAADLRWTVQASTDKVQWSDASTTFAQLQDTGGVRLVGPPKGLSEKRKYYRLSMTIDPGVSVDTSMAHIADANRYGMSGNASWVTDPLTGELVSSGSKAGETSLLLAEVEGPKTIDFEMAVSGAGSNDSLVFYIDGVVQSQTRGAVIRVQRSFTTPGTHLLMWEFKRGTGNALIRNFAQ
ncbi:hypothetical protein [Prosthecobacter fusiformis]|nr:hypothetical protein [Prosthecobacter fusiformis]